MSTPVGLQESLTKPLDEAVWQAWVAKGQTQERRSDAARVKAAKCLPIAALLVAAAMWSNIAPYEVAVRFVVAVGGIAVMLAALHARQYVFAAVFGAVAALYNPVAPVFSFSGDWQRFLVLATAVLFAAALAWRNERSHARAKPGVTVSSPALTSLLLVLGVMPAVAWAQDLSKYRNFQFGADLPTIAQQTGIKPADTKTIHRRPALIQELTWRPQPLGVSAKTEPAQEVVFSFYEGELFRVVVNYDRYETEGLTHDDVVQAISATYGRAAKPPAGAEPGDGPSGIFEEVLARWQDPQYRYDLIHSSYGPSYRLVGVLKRLEGRVQAAILEAKRLDDQEAPKRDAARLRSDEDAAQARLDKARLVNKPKFRP